MAVKLVLCRLLLTVFLKTVRKRLEKKLDGNSLSLNIYIYMRGERERERERERMI